MPTVSGFGNFEKVQVLKESFFLPVPEGRPGPDL